jgi:hypothetical protein
MKETPKKDPTLVTSQHFSAAGSAQNTDFIAECERSGDAAGAVAAVVKIRRTKGKQEEVISLMVEEIPSLVAILSHAQSKLIPAVNEYGRPKPEKEE